MTLTLEDVKNVRFPIAKRVGEGYRATEVDDFVDKVDLTFATMLEENERLQAQLEALDGAAPGEQDELAQENERLKAELAELRSAPAQDSAEAEEVKRLRLENDELLRQLKAVRGELEQARQSTGLTVMDASGDGKVEKIIVSTAAQASPAVTRLVQLATEQAEAVVAEAQGTAQRTLEEADRKAQELTLDAQTRAERTESEARVSADQVTAAARAEAERLANEAQANSERVNADAEKRRRELFTTLEAERDQLVVAVDGLRSFEHEYRTNLTEHLTRQIEALQAASMEPADAPALVDEQRATPAQRQDSATPRLDALLAEGN